MSYTTFTLIIYTSDGNEYHEHGQTIKTIQSTLGSYNTVTEAAIGDDHCGWITIYVKEWQ